MGFADNAPAASNTLLERNSSLSRSWDYLGLSTPSGPHQSQV
jgi:hypothetical protein